MSTRNTYRKKEGPKKPKAKKGKISRSVMDLLTGEILSKEEVTKHLPYLFYLVFLLVGVIGYRYYSEKNLRGIIRVENELNELRVKHIAVKEQLTRGSLQSQVAEDVEAMGLRESLDPPVQIEKEKED